MQIEKISITVGGTFNVGDYSNRKLEVHLEAKLSEGDVVDVVQSVLSKQATTALVDELLTWVEADEADGFDETTTPARVRLALKYSKLLAAARSLDPDAAKDFENTLVEKYGVAAEPPPAPPMPVYEFEDNDFSDEEDDGDDDDFEDEDEFDDDDDEEDEGPVEAFRRDDEDELEDDDEEIDEGGEIVAYINELEGTPTTEPPASVDGPDTAAAEAASGE